MRKIISVLVAATILAIGSPAGAQAKKTELTLAYMADAGFATAVVIKCDPASGVHPNAKKVCKTLTKVKGDPNRIKPAKTICTLEYAPITAEATGIWKGKKVKWSKKFSNSCDMRRATGVLFTF
jgi:hypothetical protein